MNAAALLDSGNLKSSEILISPHKILTYLVDYCVNSLSLNSNHVKMLVASMAATAQYFLLAYVPPTLQVKSYFQNFNDLLCHEVYYVKVHFVEPQH
jgi:hypothetical protein